MVKIFFISLFSILLITTNVSAVSVDWCVDGDWDKDKNVLFQIDEYGISFNIWVNKTSQYFLIYMELRNITNFKTYEIPIEIEYSINGTKYYHNATIKFPYIRTFDIEVRNLPNKITKEKKTYTIIVKNYVKLENFELATYTSTPYYKSISNETNEYSLSRKFLEIGIHEFNYTVQVEKITDIKFVAIDIQIKAETEYENITYEVSWGKYFGNISIESGKENKWFISSPFFEIFLVIPLIVIFYKKFKR